MKTRAQLVPSPLPMQSLARARRVVLPILLAALAIFLAAWPARAGEIQVREVGLNLIEVTGGSGANAWAIRYGTMRLGYPAARDWVQAAPGEGDRAWFSHGGWLRLIDTRRGVVIGRWFFPGRILGLKPAGSRIEVEFLDEYSNRQSFRQTVLFNPAAPAAPAWPNNLLLYGRVASAEGDVLAGLSKLPGSLERARERLPQVEQTLARDALSPWIMVFYGHLLKALGDPRGRAAFERAVRLPGIGYYELLPISSYLDLNGEHDLAREAFDRGYRDFWQRGYDPRLFRVLMYRYVTYPTPFRDFRTVPESLRAEVAERIYRLVPHAEGAELAWRFYADHLARTGPPEQARLWEQRAREAIGQSGFFTLGEISAVPDIAILSVLAAFVALVIFVFVLYRRYNPQRKLDLAACERALGPRPAISLAWLKKCTPVELGLYFLVAFGVYLFVFWRLPQFDSAASKVILGTFLLTPFTALYLVVLYARRGRRLPVAAAQQEQPGEVSLFDFKQWDRPRWATFLIVMLVGWYFMASTAYTPLQFWSDWTGGTYGKNQEDPFWLWFGVLFAFPSSAAVSALVVVYLVFDWPRRRRARKQAGIPRRIAFFGLEYWSRRDRFGFFLIVLAGWFLAGLVTVYVGAILRLAAAPLSIGAGSMAGPVNAWWLENRLPPSPERNLFLAISYHQSGELEKAERLYRSLPQSAKAWNNLGVMLKNTGREADAQQAWRRARELDPALAEASLNLGQPPASLWTELHREYNPGQAMLAPPSHQDLIRAALARTPAGILKDALAGPLRFNALQLIAEDPLWYKGGTLLFFVALAVALALIFLIPVREVTVAPSRGHAVWETLLPGTSPVYGAFGGLLLHLWIVLLVQDLFIFWKGTARFLTWIAVPNLEVNYALPAKFSSEELLKIGGPFNPGWTWVLVVPLAIFAVNLYLVWRSRRAA